jgi:hypothetical protein
MDDMTYMMMSSNAQVDGLRSQVEMEPIGVSNLKQEPAFLPLSCLYEDPDTSTGPPSNLMENIPFVEIKKEDIDMIEKAAEVLDARSKAFQPNIEYLAISDSPLSLVKNAKNAFERAMNSALLIEVKKAGVDECKVKARTRLQSKFSSEGVKTFVTVNCNLGEIDAFNSDAEICVLNSHELNKNLSTSQVNNLSLAQTDFSDIGCTPTAVPAASRNDNAHCSTFVNDVPLDLTRPGNTSQPMQMLSTSTVACDVLQAMVDCAADELAKASNVSKPEETTAEGKTIEIHLYSEPKSVIQHRNRCIKKSQVEQIKKQAKDGDGENTSIRLLRLLIDRLLFKDRVYLCYQNQNAKSIGNFTISIETP